ncbi:hypothetical protein DFH06DRAFT_1395515 [Mycena polygramma]|nr:hypothetical protein DFH06DRAFT_1395515 [Mycena polygramma]
MAGHRSQADTELVDGLSTRVLTEFRDYIFPQPYINANPGVFLDTSWVSIPALRCFLEARDCGGILGSSPAATAAASRVKREIDASDASFNTVTVKPEPAPTSLPFRVRSVMDGGREVMELLSDSDDEDPPLELDSEVQNQGPAHYSIPQTASETPNRNASIPVGLDTGFGVQNHGTETSSASSRAATPDTGGDGLQPSDTVWLDDYMSSMYRDFNQSFTSDARTFVERIEYFTEIPSVMPVPRRRTAFVLDCSAPKFDILDEHGTLIPVEVLAKGQDNDSWHGPSGAGDPPVDVTFAPGEPPISCRRKRNDCKGCHHCSQLDNTLVDVTRYELEVGSRDVVLAAQRDTRRHEGDTAEKRATAFFDRVKSTKCTARRSDGELCDGKPKLMEKKEGKSRGHIYWVACDGWTPAFKEHHRTHSIPDNVEDDLIYKLFKNQPLANDDSLDTNPCSRIVHPHIGGKRKHCHHPHIVNGVALTECPIIKRPCPCKRTYYIPIDPTIRKILIFHPKGVPHNRPVPPPLKMSAVTKSKYSQCVQAVGLLGTTVAKVDNAASTRLLLNGQKPGQYTPALQNKRIKQDLIAREKKKKYPAGLGVTGVYDLYRQDLEKPLDERYIHRFEHRADGGLIIFTCYTRLLALLDDPGVEAFEDDTTFKRIEGEFNEWEVVIFYDALERAVTLARAYINRADTAFFERRFDIFREIKTEATGKDIRFARFMPNGNLLVMNADMEAAQVLGAARSILKTNVPSFSGITTLDPQLSATFFIKFCAGHAQRPIPDFKGLVSSDEYNRIKDFRYIDSPEALASYSQFIAGLGAGAKKVKGSIPSTPPFILIASPVDWWAHKEMNDWIIPCLVKSQSNILPEHWDRTPSTTNTGEAQHHWTNSRTGIKQTLVEGLEGRVLHFSLARGVDWDTVLEVETSTTTGVLLNSNNEMFNRQGRNSHLQSNAAKKSREVAKAGERKAELQAKINDHAAQLKASKAELKSLTGTSKRSASSRKTGDEVVIVSASSCGRVKTVPLPKRGKGAVNTPIERAPATDADGTADRSVPTASGMLPDYSSEILPAHYSSASFFSSSGLSASFGVASDFTTPYHAPTLTPSALTGTSFDTPMASLFNSGFGFNSTGLDYNLDMLFGHTSTSTPDLSDASGFQSDFDWSCFMPTQDGISVPATVGFESEGWSSDTVDWSALTPQTLPTLPPPPASSPPQINDSPPSSPEPAPAKAIVLDLDEANIVTSKRARTVSSRAAAASPVSKKPRSR